ncbi:hypothetical protein SEA_JORDENNIS_36 [Mycobacterium phage Jordennis]|uniref:Uncharacterized protein n=5 Tax=Caudoviricetes TaxID=2731619 RepID=A0A1C9LYT9_9CAUD|nr:hypothetical protein SEA_GRUUNAGA_36 [Mycobacterium phage Gruunaga]AVP42159.1 hypothetical protein SEA_SUPERAWESOME_36 [Mycobacterium phage SuperAwesome]QBP28937.1 hypothetical protein SEA_JORDENNIS_36 [Mycobacterium phage Jordennis]UAJ16365.1 hypothetical protein SEA_NEWRALA_36 [Mycobacterium phage Newrala]
MTRIPPASAGGFLRFEGYVRQMKPIDRMSPREREHLIRELEIEHRQAVGEAARVKREIRSLTAQLEQADRRVRELESGIAALRGD